MDVTVTHDRYGRTTKRTNRALTVSSTGPPQSDRRYFEQYGQNKDTTYRQLCVDRPDPIVFLPVAVSTSRHVYDDFVRLLVLHEHGEVVF